MHLKLTVIVNTAAATIIRMDIIAVVVADTVLTLMAGLQMQLLLLLLMMILQVEVLVLLLIRLLLLLLLVLKMRLLLLLVVMAIMGIVHTGR